MNTTTLRHPKPDRGSDDLLEPSARDPKDHPEVDL